MSKILYLKIDQCVQVSRTAVTIGEIAKMECTDPSIVNRLKAEKFMELGKSPVKRRVVSVLAVIKIIHAIYPQLQIENLGESDFILSLEKEKGSKIMEYAKILLVCTISFFGSVFAMMTFQEDASVLDSFQKVYTWVMGTSPSGPTILEFSYSLGISVGIILFFNHFGKKKLTEDPSPVEVEMSGYDKEVYTALIMHAGRKGEEKDVE